MSDDPGPALAERERMAALTADVGNVLVRGGDLDASLQGCCAAMAHRLDAVRVSIWTLDDADDEALVLRANAGADGADGAAAVRIAIGDGPVGGVAKERVSSTGDGATMIAPLLVGDRLSGVLAIDGRAPLGAITRAGLAVIAQGLALGIDRQRTEARLRAQTEVVATINRLGQVLSAELAMDKLVQAVVDAATELTGADFGSFFYNVADERGGSYMLYALAGAPREAFAHLPMPRATALFGPTFRGEGTIRLGDVRRDPRYGHSGPHHGMPAGHLPVCSYLAVSVVSRSGEVIGGLFFGHSGPNAFTERHERIVEGLAAQTAIAMDNARLYQRAREALDERQHLLAREQTARREAEIASRAKDEFLSMLSHELRTPLNAILGWTRLLGTGRLDATSIARAVETIDRNAKLQAHLIEDMLDVSRIISGKLRLDAQPVDLTTVVGAAVDTLRPAAEAKGIRVQVVLDFGAGVVLGDAVRLQQIVWNLLSNAIKFTPKNGSVRVQLQRVDSHVELAVSDTGPGIDAEFLPHMFDRFRQADSAITRTHGGLGLGLAIVRHLVELHGGSVEAHNRADQSGAVVTVALPVMVVRAAAPAASTPERVHPVVSGAVPFDRPPTLQDVDVVAVDDDADARRLVAAVLEDCGAVVRACGSSAEAMSALAERVPDVLVSDIGMPDEDGYAFIRRVRGQGFTVPAVALTAYARVEDRMQALSAGYDMHVPKPVEPAELAVVVASLVHRRARV